MSLEPESDAVPGPGSLIEDFGRRIGRAMGWPPMAGRTAGVLMLAEEPLTLAQLQHALDASKGSVSEMTRLLMVNGVVERIKEPGRRQLVYRWRADAWVGCLQHQLGATTELLELVENSTQRTVDLSALQRGRLGDMHDYYRFMASRMADLLDEYTVHRDARR